ncbi:MAG: pilus assembly protein TadG-related protein [Candidatus Velamenicoccus archaeovorus]
MRVRLTSVRDERGAVIPIVVISLIALFGMVVLTVDVGGLMVKRRAMVNASDAAALAAAQSYTWGNEAQCGTNDAPAQAQADAFAVDNVSGAARTDYQTDCVKQNVTVAYQTQQDLFFAAVLGFGDNSNVTSTATAHWGPTTGGTPMPVELDPLITNECVYEGGAPDDPDNPSNYKDPGTCPEGYWFNNGDLTSSGWGLMNLNTWGVDPGASCDNSGGANDLAGWILQEPGLSALLRTIPTYVCTTDGGKTSDWMNALQSVAGNDQIYLFPVNDPSRMIFGPPTSQQKYAVVAFAPMKVVAVYDVGKDPEAALGGTYACDANYTFPGPNQTIDLSSVSLTGLAGSDCSHVVRSDITGVKVSPPGPGGQAYKDPSDYHYDAATHELTWKKAGATVEVEFSYRGGGACPGHEPDPNAFCLQLAWAGPVLIGVTDPDSTGSGPGMAVTLVR